jgi:hypothetical protein
LIDASLCALLLVAGCATTAELPRRECRAPKLLVCDGRSRPEVAKALSRVAPALEYGWEYGACALPALAAAAANECRANGPCEVPAFVDGVPLADPDSTYDVVFIVAGTDSVAIHKEKHIGFKVAHERSANRKPFGADYEVVSTDETPEGLNGPVYLFDPRSGTILTTRKIENGDVDSLRAQLADVLDDLCRGRIAIAR